MFENLSDKLERAFKVLKGHGKISEINVAETVKEIRKALLEADVNYKLAKTFTETIKQKALGQKVLTAISPGQLLTKIVNDELTTLMGGTASTLNLNNNPSIILIAGLQGSGKTTLSGKLAKHLQSTGKKPLLIACDIYRPAAIDQLKILGTQINIPVHANYESKDPVQIAQEGLNLAKQNHHNVVIIDTAGRLAIDQAMMDEITRIKHATNPHEILFVVDAMTGQDAVNTAKIFNQYLDFTGVVLTKLDGDTRGGAALSIKAELQKPIKFIGTGEKLDALAIFHPDRMASRILGMGDVVSLVERAQEQFDAQQANELNKKIRKNQFDFNDFLDQLQQIKKMGNVKDLIGMMPGLNKLPNTNIDDNNFKPLEAIIRSMTPHERSNPATISTSHRQRIARGSGTSIQEVNKLLKQFEEMKKMMKLLSNPANALNAMKNMPRMP